MPPQLGDLGRLTLQEGTDDQFLGAIADQFSSKGFAGAVGVVVGAVAQVTTPLHIEVKDSATFLFVGRKTKKRGV